MNQAHVYTTESERNMSLAVIGHHSTPAADVTMTTMLLDPVFYEQDSWDVLQTSPFTIILPILTSLKPRHLEDEFVSFLSGTLIIRDNFEVTLREGPTRVRIKKYSSRVVPLSYRSVG